MTQKKINNSKVLLSITIIFFSFISSYVFAEESKTIHIKVYNRTLTNGYFYGFGAETLPWLWTKENKDAGVNEEDIRINVERIKQMELPLTRIFVPWETWNPSLDYQTFTWDSDKMKSLYKTLDLYQKMGTRVILVTVDWVKDSPWKNAEASAKAVLRLLEYLVKEKGYSCVQFWTLTNEPELTYGWLRQMPFKNYVQIHRLVKKGLRGEKLPVKIIGSDEVGSQSWFKNSVQSLHRDVDVFSSHAYFYPKEAHLIPSFFKERISIIKRISKKNMPFFLAEFGFRGNDFGVCTNSFIEDYDYGIYTAILCLEALNSGVSTASLWSLHQVRLINEATSGECKTMRIGLWAYKDKDWQIFPTFYLYQFFTKYIKPGSRVLKTTVSHPGLLKVSCVKQSANYSLFVVNATDKEQRFLIEWKGLNADFKKYLYSKSKFPIHNENSFKADSRIDIKDCIEDKIPPKSVILYTNF